MNGSANNLIVFRKSRKGYDKEDVHRYIEEMNIRFSAAEEQAKSRIRQLEAELEVARAAAGNPADAEVLAALTEENATLKAELEALKQTAAEAPEASSEALLSYDEASRRLGDILLKANLDADRIVAEAEEEAGRQLSGAEKQADDIRLDATVAARLMTDRVKRRLTQLTGEYLDSLELLSAASAEEYRKLYDELKEKLTRVGREASGMLTDL